jgi:hypothetical protein
MEHISELLRHHLTGPRWEVTRDVLAQQPDVLSELCRSMEHELRLVIDQIEKRETAVDVRITAEDLVLVLGRLMPVVSAVVADLYMMHVVDIEHDADGTLPAVTDGTAAQLRTYLGDLLKRRTTDEALQQVVAVLDTSVTLAALHLESLRLLKELMTTRLEAQGL